MKKHCIKWLVWKINSKDFRQASGLILIMLFMSINPIFAKSAYSQGVKFNLSLKSATIEEIFDEIRNQSEFEFFYNNDQINTNKKVDVNVKNASIEQVLDIVLNGQFNYKIEDRYILLTKNENNRSASIQSTQQQTNTIVGIVKEKNDDPMVGVSVVVVGTNRGTSTNVDGKYSIQANPGETVAFSYLGFQTIKKVVETNTRNMDIVLLEDVQMLDEVVVVPVGFGAIKKANLTGAVSTVKMDDVLGSRPISSTAMALSGAISGVRVSTSSGQPGADVSLNIRGTGRLVQDGSGNWVTTSPQPLILVDNVPIEDISMINPNDIETVTVLKDAAASAIHGARAAFGVVLITTKHGGKEQKARISYSNSFAFNSPLELAEKASGIQLVQGWLDAGKTNSPFGGGQKLDTWMSLLQDYQGNASKYPLGYQLVDGVRYDLKEYDVYKNFLNNSGFQQAHNLSVTGGSSKSTYRMSFGYTNEDGVIVTDKDGYRRYNATISATTDVTKWLNVQGEVLYSQSMTTSPNGNSNGGYWGKANGGTVLTPDGMTDYVGGEMLPIVTPANLVKYGDMSKTRMDDIRLVGRAVVTPFAGFTGTAEFTYYNNKYNYTNYDKVVKMVDPDKWAIAYTSNNISKFTKANNFDDHTALNIFGNYQKTLNKAHNISVTGGFNQEYEYYEYLTANNTYMINSELPSIRQGTGTKDANDDYYQYAIRGLYYRVNYDYKGRYLFEANGRYDGSSKFPKDDRFGFFPSFSAGWRISEEAFMESLKPTLSNLKFRGSWGNIGNQNINMYQYFETMGSGSARWANGDGLRYTALGAPSKVSNTFTWERVQTLDFGADIGLFGGRLNGVFDWYNRKTLGMLAPGADLPAVAGYSSPLENTADLSTKGWEAELTWKDKVGKVSYHFGFNVFDAQTTVDKFSDNENKLLNQSMYQGKKVGEIWGLTSVRYYTEDDFSDYAKGVLKDGIPSIKGQSRHFAGDVMFKDLDGDNVISTGFGYGQTADKPGDYKVIGNSTPRYNFGVNGGASWNNFDFSFFLQGVGKRDLWLGINEMTIPYGAYDFSGLFKHLTDYWTPENPDAKYPRFYNNTGNYTNYNYQTQTKLLQNGAYLRVKNITIGYTVPKNILKKINIEQLRFFASGENLHTFKSTPKGLQPDLDGQGSTITQYPFMRMMSFGLNLSF